MPLALRVGPYSFRFFGIDRDEPPHVHVMRDRYSAKFWIDPLVRLSKNAGFKPHELNKIAKIIVKNREKLMEAWHDFFGH